MRDDFRGPLRPPMACACGAAKETRNMFCALCFKALPVEMRDDLWTEGGRARAEAFLQERRG